MSVATKQSGSHKFSSVSVVILMVLTSLASLALVDYAKASTTGNISIIGSTPSEFDFIPAYEPTYFTVELNNSDTDPSDPRTISWYVCLGEKVTNVCISQRIDEGSILVPAMAPGEVSNFTSMSGFYPNGINETITVIYQFDELDTNPSDDILNFKLNSTLEYTDFKIEVNENIIDSLPNLAFYNGIPLLSNNTQYNITFSGFANLCATCHLNASLGWQLWNENQSNMITEFYEYTENFPKYSFYKSFQMLLPTFAHDEDGTYTLVYGIFDSTGNPYGDLNDDNNLNSVTIVINTELDITIDNLYPSHNPSALSYLYGENMVSVLISNNGNATANSFAINLIISDGEQEQDTQTCNIDFLMPGQQRTCVFNMPMHGSAIDIQATLPSQIGNIFDSNTADNTIQETAEVIVSQMSTTIEISNQKEWYTDAETIPIAASINPYSPGPVNFSWWYSGLINIDYGQQILLNTSDYGLGSHTFKLISTDVLGNSEILYFSILVYSQISIDNAPFYSASATSPSNTVEIIHDSALPTIRQDYNIGGSNMPLMLYQFDLVDTSTNSSIFDGQNWLDVELNLFHTLPEGVSYMDVELRKLNSFDDQNWEFFNQEHYGFVNETVMYARLYEPTTILVIGDLGEPNIEARNFSVGLISDGNLRLTWEDYGDVDSDYIIGWNIHQKIVPEFGGTIFESPQENYNQLIWDDLVLDSFRAFVPLGQTSWDDLITVPDGFCSSYAIIPVDRTGETFNQLANVSMENGTAAPVCGDSTPPSTSVANMQVNSRFTNDTSCFDQYRDWNMCYEVTISWIWPTAGETNETWNMYRTEQNPNGMDLSLLEPILSDMTYTPNETYTYTVSGMDDNTIRPMKTFYYILTPSDEYGNERTVIIYPSANVVRLHIENEWWDYNQHIIPEPEPEPEPPLGSEWLGDFSDNLEQEEFQTAGIVTLSTLCIGVIMLAFITKRLKRLRKVVAARNKRLAAESMADEFDDFF